MYISLQVGTTLRTVIKYIMTCKAPKKLLFKAYNKGIYL